MGKNLNFSATLNVQHTFSLLLRTRTARMTQAACAALCLQAVSSAPLSAQATTGVTPAVAATITRVRTMADGGDGDKARTVLDSLVNAVPRESVDAGEALYWRALLSEQSPNAERDWKQLVVEVPMSPRVPDALVRLAELDIMHNNTSAARQHANRLISDYPDAPQRPRALVVLAQAYFTDNDAPHACGVLTVVRREAPLSAVEVRLQADEMQQQCRNVREVAMGASGDATPPVVAPPAVAPTVATAPVAGAAGRGAASPRGTPPKGAVTGAATGAAAVTSADLGATLAAREAAAKATRDSIASAAAARDVAAKASRDSAAAASNAKALAAQNTRDSIAAAKTARDAAARNVRDSIAAARVARDVAAKAMRDSIAATTAAAAAKAAAAIPPTAGRSDISASEREVAAQIVRDSLAAIRLAAERKTRDSLVNVVAERRAATDAKGGTKAAATPAPTVSTTGRWTLQVAAYDTRAQADALVKKLNANDMPAHTVGAKKPFRVQVGRFETRAEAADALTGMKKKGVNGFISEWAKR